MPSTTGGELTIAASRVLWPDGTLSPGEVHVADGRIVGVGRPAGPVPDRVVAPGFVDLQVNGIGDLSVPELARRGATDPGWQALDAALLAQGVTSWCPTFVTAPLPELHAGIDVVRARAARGATGRPRIIGAHLEGPWLGEAHGAHRSEHVVAPEPDAVASLPDGVALVTLGPEAEGAAAAVAALAARGVVVSLGHSRADYEQGRAAVDAGARMVTHLANAMGPLSARDPGLIGLALADDRLAVAVIADLVHVHPAVLRLAAGAAGASRLVLVTDAIAWRAPAEVERGVSLVDGAPRLTDGTIAGSVLTMDRAVRNVVSSGAADLATALRAASANPARVAGLHDRGALRIGARADLVVLDAGLDVVETWVGGVRAAG